MKYNYGNFRAHFGHFWEILKQTPVCAIQYDPKTLKVLYSGIKMIDVNDLEFLTNLTLLSGNDMNGLG